MIDRRCLGNSAVGGDSVRPAKIKGSWGDPGLTVHGVQDADFVFAATSCFVVIVISIVTLYS